MVGPIALESTGQTHTRILIPSFSRCGLWYIILLSYCCFPKGVRVSNQILKVGRTMCGSSPWMNTSVSHRLMLSEPRGTEAVSRSVCGDAKSVGKPLVLQRMIQMKY